MWLVIKREKSHEVLDLDWKCLTMFYPTVLLYLIPLKNPTKQENVKAKSTT